VRSKVIREDGLASLRASIGEPSIPQIEALRSRSRIRAELCHAMTCGSKRATSGPNERLPNAAAFVRGFNKQRPNTAVAGIAGGHAFDDAILLPNIDWCVRGLTDIR
jgi:hypothetical protein